LGEEDDGYRTKRQLRPKVKANPNAVARLALAAAATLSAAAIGGDGTLVRTKDGPVQGFINNGIYEFLGIPYATPPVGSLRWMPPRPHKAWNTPLQAAAFGSNCPQNYEFGVFAGPPSVDENCLF
jgi:para-nitrobenzyl esterase